MKHWNIYITPIFVNKASRFPAADLQPCVNTVMFTSLISTT